MDGSKSPAVFLKVRAETDIQIGIGKGYLLGAIG